MILLFCVPFVLVLIDQYTKHLAVTKLKPVSYMEGLQYIFDFRYVENRGAAFGMLQNQQLFFKIMTVTVIFIMVFLYIKLLKQKGNIYIRLSMLLILGGAIGNFIDRIKNGFVVDFISVTFMNFPVFNFADMCVSVGAFFFAVIIIFFDKEQVLI